MPLAQAIEAAVVRRRSLLAPGDPVAPTTAFRLIHTEADGLPGVAVDVYDRFLVLHAFDLTERREADVVDALGALPYDGLYLKRHPRQKNDVVDAKGTAWAPEAPVWGEAACDPLVVHEHGVPYGAWLGDGFRTGIFLDQRDNRRRLARLSTGKRVLNLFAYTGAFSVAALSGGAAHARCVDVSAAALRRAEDNVARIDATDRHRTWAADAFFALERLDKRREVFDIVVLDPPSYATAGKRRFRVTRDYPDLVARCVRVLAPGGHLLACVNHHQVGQGLLRAYAREGAAAAGRTIADLRDHSSQLDFPAVAGREPLAKSLLMRLA